VFEGAEGKPMDRSVAEAGGQILLVPQFTILGDMRKGRRPSFDAAAPPDQARELYECLVRELRTTGLVVETGEFKTTMQVALVNEGPVTVLVDSKRLF
jgi:D-tyrosyl-tRNA(Tyr) deacylase